MKTNDIGVNFAGHRYTDASIAKIIAESEGVNKIVSISNSLKEVPTNKRLAHRHPNVYYTIGVHPHDAKSIVSLDMLDTLVSCAKDTKVYAIGECGLDYNRMYSPRDIQLQVFRKQICIARDTALPLYLHCRDAYDDFISVIKSEGYYCGIVHCFTGTTDQAVELTSLGFYIGITGWLLDKRRNHDLVEAIPNIPMNQILVETDAPFLSAVKGRSSHPSDTSIIVQEIARIKGIDPEEAACIIYNNATEFWRSPCH